MKKIMFNDKCGLTQAVLEGRKTQTRRIIPSDFFSLNWEKQKKITSQLLKSSGRSKLCG